MHTIESLMLIFSFILTKPLGVTKIIVICGIFIDLLNWSSKRRRPTRLYIFQVYIINHMTVIISYAISIILTLLAIIRMKQVILELLCGLFQHLGVHGLIDVVVEGFGLG